LQAVIVTARPHRSVQLWVDRLHARPAVLEVAAVQSVAAVQPHAPLTHWSPAGVEPVQTAQVPELPHAPAVLPVTQWPVEQQEPLLQVPLPGEPHTSVQLVPLQVGLSPEQPVHTPPVEPQALLAVPATHTPVLMPDGMEQQPPLHGMAAEHAVVQVCVLMLQVPVPGQSLLPLQPHLPPPVTASQTLPVDALAQLAHSPPVEPQLLLAVPIWQVPVTAALQQPPLHGCVELHEVVHTWLTVSQAFPAGQSPAPKQPHTPVARQACPLLSPLQSMQVPPPVATPQWAPSMSTHAPLSQQKVAPQGADALQVSTHWPALQVGVPSVHTLQKFPSLPQLSLAPPLTHSPVLPSQQPPLQMV
jgi:hypothetical protein